MKQTIRQRKGKLKINNIDSIPGNQLVFVFYLQSGLKKCPIEGSSILPCFRTPSISGHRQTLHSFAQIGKIRNFLIETSQNCLAKYRFIYNSSQRSSSMYVFIIVFHIQIYLFFQFQLIFVIFKNSSKPFLNLFCSAESKTLQIYFVFQLIFVSLNFLMSIFMCFVWCGLCVVGCQGGSRLAMFCCFYQLQLSQTCWVHAGCFHARFIAPSLIAICCLLTLTAIRQKKQTNQKSKMKKNENENCTILIPKGNLYCCLKSSARRPVF